MNYMNKFFLALEKMTQIACFTFMCIIVISMACQVGFRYLLNSPLTHTDEISLMALTWLTFIGMAWLYRRQEHITVELVPVEGSITLWKRLIHLFIQVTVIIIMMIIIGQIIEAAPRALNVKLGTLEISRFTQHYLPLLIGGILVVLFAIEHSLNAILGRPMISPDHHSHTLEN